MLNLVFFFILSAVILLLSRTSAGAGGAEWIYRPAALELLLILTLLQREHWFEQPFSTPQLFSWLFLMIALGLAVSAWLPRGANSGATPLARRGIYRLIRHPFYAALLFLGWGVFFKSLARIDGLAFLEALLLACATLLLISAARVEETDDYARWGAEYTGYLKATKMFIPFLF